ncbi:enoyl-[acyl-carrier-protein] reductase, mitochondrial [Trichomonascus vanleenenianus]|uniref:enoyl-[acyl-carrier-protein] reductase n=1 Tax=Trichomonascus vanleenenianus TaxID=2268995 RepID=UPI003ECB1005
MASKILRRAMTTKARAFVFPKYGDPREVVKPLSVNVPEPKDNEVQLKLLAFPINPSDINQIQGIYPSRPVFREDLGTSEPVAIGGNEGVYEVVKVGSKVSSAKVGDWAVPASVCFGTWRTGATVDEKAMNYIPDHANNKPIQVATVSVNPTTAHQMLKEFVDLHPGDFFIQNGANSGVGRAAIQFGKLWGLKSINIVRDRPDLDKLKKELQDLGATYVITEEELGDKEFDKQIKEWTKDSEIKLALNCIGGKNCTNMSRKLSPGGHLVTYGGMSGQPLTFGVGSFIFQDIHAHGYWVSAWGKKNPGKKFELVKKLLKMMADGELVEPPVSTVKLSLSSSDEELGKVITEALANTMASKGKQLITLEE